MRRPDASTFQRFLKAAWSAWYDLDSTMRCAGRAHIYDIIELFNKFVDSVGSMRNQLRPGGISDDDRETIKQILLGDLGEEYTDESHGIQELLIQWENGLSITESERPGWDTMAEKVNSARARLAETLGVQRD